MINISCNRSEKNVASDFVLVDNSQKLEKSGKILYYKFCVACHGSKETTDGFLVSSIKNVRYELSF